MSRETSRIKMVILLSRSIKYRLIKMIVYFNKTICKNNVHSKHRIRYYRLNSKII